MKLSDADLDALVRYLETLQVDRRKVEDQLCQSDVLAIQNAEAAQSRPMGLKPLHEWGDHGVDSQAPGYSVHPFTALVFLVHRRY